MVARPTPDAVDFIWKQAEKRLEAQLRQADALDTKAGVLLGVHVLAAGLIASVAGDLAGGTRWVGIASIIGLLVSGWFSFRAFRAQEYERSPAPQTMWRFSRWTEEEIQQRFLSTRFQVIHGNDLALRAKARDLLAGLTILGVIALVVAAATIVSLVS